MASDRVRNRPQGFTLIEVMIASAMAVVLASLIAVQFSRYFAHLSLTDAANDLHQLVLFSQEKSVVERHPVKIEIHFSEGRYRLLEETPGRFGREVTLPEKIECLGSRKEIQCFPDGACREGTWRLRQESEIYEIVIAETPSSVTLRKVLL